MRHLELLHGESIFLCEQLVDRNRLLAVGGSVIEHDQLLAFEVVEAAQFRSDVVDNSGGLTVRIQQERKDVGEHASIGGVGAAVVDRNEWGLVLRDPVNHRIGDADRERVPRSDARMILQALVDLYPALDLILRLAFLPRELHAVHAAVAEVDEIQVIDEASEKTGAAGSVGADPIALQGEELLVSSPGVECGKGDGYGDCRGKREPSPERWDEFHRFHRLLGVDRRRLFRRSQRAARPSGSAMRKKMMSRPRTMRWLMSSTPESKRSPSRKLPTRERISGKTTSSAAPKNAPRIDARPPIMMKTIWNERSRLNPAGSTVRK